MPSVARSLSARQAAPQPVSTQTANKLPANAVPWRLRFGVSGARTTISSGVHDATSIASAVASGISRSQVCWSSRPSASTVVIERVSHAAARHSLDAGSDRAPERAARSWGGEARTRTTRGRATTLARSGRPPRPAPLLAPSQWRPRGMLLAPALAKTPVESRGGLRDRKAERRKVANGEFRGRCNGAPRSASRCRCRQGGGEARIPRQAVLDPGQVPEARHAERLLHGARIHGARHDAEALGQHRRDLYDAARAHGLLSLRRIPARAASRQ